MTQYKANQQSVMSHRFSQIPSVSIPRSSFDRSHAHKTTFDAGWLIPIYVDEALPGDTFNLKGTYYTRLATPIKPVMDNMYLDTFYFAVPKRLLWDNWERMMGAQDDPGDSTDFTVPEFTNTTGVDIGQLHDYMGIPPGIPDLTFNCFHARAYRKIFNEWFRDENLQDSLAEFTGDAPGNLANDNDLLRRGKRHDYFTSCLPFPQKGTAVSIPLGTTAPVVSQGTGLPTFDAGSLTDEAMTASGATPWALSLDGQDPGATQEWPLSWNDTALETDLTGATAATINALRQSFQIQRMFERDARGGTRYTEINLSHFGVRSPDQRLQRAEYLGGGSVPINFTVIPVTAESFTGDINPGDVGAYATGVAHSGFTKSFTEHCVIIGLASVRADLTYQQGLERMWSRQTRFDYFWPSLAHLGEQSVLNKEIFAVGSGGGGTDDAVFGYQERFAEYRYAQSRISGIFRSTDPAPLDFWHLSQEFGSLPVLGDTFIQDNPPIDRVVFTPADPHFLFDSYFKLRCARPMPIYGVPGMIDHF